MLTALNISALISSFVLGLSVQLKVGDALASARIKKSLGATSKQNLFLSLMIECSKPGQKKYAPASLISDSRFNRDIELAGMKGQITSVGFCEARFRLSMFGGLAGFILGLLASFEVAIAFGVSVALGTFMYSRQFLKQKAAIRTTSLERHLPEMLDVIGIGARSGLSFDRSLSIYCDSFDTPLSHDFSVAQSAWTHGLKSRQQALRDIANSYDSAIFSRFIESLIRCIKLGTSMAQTLEASAQEARSAYRAKREEEVRRAPIKMLIPTGALILPAMLMLVLGPVLLELISGSAI